MKLDPIFHPLSPAEQGEAAVKSATRSEHLHRIHESPAGRVRDLPVMPTGHKAMDVDANNRFVRKQLALLRQTDPEFQRFIAEQSRNSEVDRRFWLRYFSSRNAADQFWMDYDLKVKNWLEHRIKEIASHAQIVREAQKQRRLYAQALSMFYQALNLYESYANEKKNSVLFAERNMQGAALQIANSQHYATERLHFSLIHTPSDAPVNHTLAHSQYVLALTESRIARNQFASFDTASGEGGSFAKGSRPKFTKIS